MRGGAGFAGALLAGACGIFTAYSTFQPALQQQQEEKEGSFAKTHETPKEQDRVISQAIISDLEEAKNEVKKYDNGAFGGFAWGLRKALFGREPKQSDPSQAQDASQDATK